MSKPLPPDRNARRVVGRLIDALDRALTAVDELAEARAALDRYAAQAPLRVVGGDDPTGAFADASVPRPRSAGGPDHVA
jgi:hypothetical protein